MPLAVPGASGHRTKQEFVYRTLRDAILRCELRPDERLIIDELARRLGVSAIPVREALQILQSEGLVVNVPHVGATVASISTESIIDVFTVLEGLEIVTNRYVVQRANPADLDQLAELVRQMDEALAARQYEAWGDLNRRFHLGISALTALPLLQEMTARIFDRWDRVRRFYFRHVLMHRAPQAQEEHRQILEAMRARDVDRLQTIVRQHNHGALVAYMSYLSGQTNTAGTSA